MNGKSDYSLRLGRQEDLTQKRPIIKDLKTRFQHTYIIGKPGTGKSNLLFQMALYDALQGCGVIFIDPKGEEVRKLYYSIPDKDRILTLSFDSPYILNPLRKAGYNDSDLVQEFSEILRLLIRQTVDNPIAMTALMDMLIKEAVKVIPEEERDIDFIFGFLTQKSVREAYFKKTGRITDYWTSFDQKGNFELRQGAFRLASRLHPFQDDERMKRIVCGENELSIKQIAKEGKILLVDTSGMSFISRIYVSSLVTHAVKSYVEFELKSWQDNPPLMVYVDEFQTCVSELFPSVMARSRGYGVGFTLCHHGFSQADEKLIDRLLGAVSTFIIFRVGEEEAERLSKVFNLKPKDFFDLPDYYAWIRIGTDNTFIKTYFTPLEIPSDFELPKKEFPKEEVNFLKDCFFPV